MIEGFCVAAVASLGLDRPNLVKESIWSDHAFSQLRDDAGLSSDRRVVQHLRSGPGKG